MAHRELHDRERAFGWLGDSLVTHVDDSSLDALVDLATEVGEPSRAETVLTRALGEVFDGPLVRKLLGRRAAVRDELLSDKPGAAEDLKRLHELAPSDSDVMEKLSGLYTELEDYRGMVQLYEDQILRGRDQGQRAELARKVAQLWEERLDDAREAADAWRRVLRMKAGDAEATQGLDRAKANMLKRPVADDDEPAPPKRVEPKPKPIEKSSPKAAKSEPVTETPATERDETGTFASALAESTSADAPEEPAPASNEAEAAPKIPDDQATLPAATELSEEADVPTPYRDEELTVQAPMPAAEVEAALAEAEARARAEQEAQQRQTPTAPAPEAAAEEEALDSDVEVDVDFGGPEENSSPAVVRAPPPPPSTRPPGARPPPPPSLRASRPPPPPSVRTSRPPALPPPARAKPAAPPPAPPWAGEGAPKKKGKKKGKSARRADPDAPAGEEDGEDVGDDELFD
jgi:chemotaxis protein histidine kinase CheA